VRAGQSSSQPHAASHAPLVSHAHIGFGVTQSRSHPQPSSHALLVSHAQALPQSASQTQPASHAPLVSQAQPPLASHLASVALHASPGSQPPPAVQGQPSAPIAQLDASGGASSP
jgi:hypothetical protein